jgi:hypothetical protein
LQQPSHSSHHRIHLLLANESWRRSNRESKILGPNRAVELNVCLVNLPVIAESEDIDALDRCSAREQDEIPAPDYLSAAMPDVEGGDLIDAVAGMSVTSFDRSKVRFGDGSVSLTCEEVDAVRDFLVVRVCDRLDQGVVGCRRVATGLLSLDEGVDNLFGFLTGQAGRLIPIRLGVRVGTGSRNCDNCRESSQPKKDGFEQHFGVMGGERVY